MHGKQPDATGNSKVGGMSQTIDAARISEENSRVNILQISRDSVAILRRRPTRTHAASQQWQTTCSLFHSHFEQQYRTRSSRQQKKGDDGGEEVALSIHCSSSQGVLFEK